MNTRRCSFQNCRRNAEVKCLCTSSPTFLCDQHTGDHIMSSGGGHRIVPSLASDEWIANQDRIITLDDIKSKIELAKQKSINATTDIIIKLDKGLKYILSTFDSQLESIDQYLLQLAQNNSAAVIYSRHRTSAEEIERCCISSNEKLNKIEDFSKLMECISNLIKNINFDDLQIYEISFNFQKEINKISQNRETGKFTEELEKWNKFIDSWNEDTKIYPTSNSYWHFKQGMLKYYCGKWTEALSSFSLAKKLQPNYLDAIFYEGLSLARLKKIGSAIESWDSIIQIDPTFSIVYILKALENQSRNRLQDSISSYNELFVKCLKNSILEFLKLDALVEKQSYKEALILSNKIIEDCPTFSFAYGQKGSVLYKLGKEQEAWQCYVEAANNDQSYHQIYFNFALISLEKEELDNALYYLDLAINISQFEEHYYRTKAEILEKRNEIQEAKKCLEKIIEINPASDWVYNHIGELLLSDNKFADAIRYFNKSIKFNPTLASAYFNKGNALVKSRKNDDDALRAYKEALIIDNKLAEACFEIGNIYFHKHKYDVSRKYYGRAIEINPNHSLAYTNKGITLKLENRTEEAKDCLYVALSLDPKNHFAHFNLAEILCKENRYIDSIEYFNKAILNNPNNPEYYRAKAAALKIIGKDHESYECLLEAAKLGNIRN